MLEAIDLGYRFGSSGPWLFQGMNIRIGPGEVVGLFGPSGLGKTTFGHLLGGYLAPAQGRVLLGGAALPVRGYCPVQCVHQHPELSVNPRWRLGRTLREAYDPPEALLDSLGIAAAWLSRYPHELSGGELQRIAVARALGPGTRYLVADEMTAMLDAITQAHIWRAVMDHCRENGVGALVISHDEALLARLCSRVIACGGVTGGMSAAVDLAGMESGEGFAGDRAQAAGSAA